MQVVLRNLHQNNLIFPPTFNGKQRWRTIERLSKRGIKCSLTTINPQSTANSEYHIIRFTHVNAFS